MKSTDRLLHEAKLNESGLNPVHESFAAAHPLCSPAPSGPMVPEPLKSDTLLAAILASRVACVSMRDWTSSVVGLISSCRGARLDFKAGKREGAEGAGGGTIPAAGGRGWQGGQCTRRLCHTPPPQRQPWGRRAGAPSRSALASSERPAGGTGPAGSPRHSPQSLPPLWAKTANHSPALRVPAAAPPYCPLTWNVDLALVFQVCPSQVSVERHGAIALWLCADLLGVGQVLHAAEGVGEETQTYCTPAETRVEEVKNRPFILTEFQIKVRC